MTHSHGRDIKENFMYKSRNMLVCNHARESLDDYNANYLQITQLI